MGIGAQDGTRTRYAPGVPSPRPSFLQRLLRPRALIFSVLIFGAGYVIFAQARQQKVDAQAAVAAWLQDAVRRAEERRDGPFLLGSTEPLAAEAFAGWVRDAVPANIATDAMIMVTPTGQSFFGGDDRGITHQAVITLRKARATMGIRWQQGPGKPAGEGALVEFSPSVP
jgi:hypothetical protein